MCQSYQHKSLKQHSIQSGVEKCFKKSLLSRKKKISRKSQNQLDQKRPAEVEDDCNALGALGLSEYDHINPVLASLHWLPLQAGLRF